jgi:hypothetical protein
MEMRTTNREDFVPWEIEEADKPTEALPPQQHIPFAGRSEYNKEYPHWGDYQASPGKPIKQKWVPNNLPFEDGTVYKKDYPKKQVDKPKKYVLETGRNPIASTETEPIQTTNQGDYAKPKVMFGPPEQVIATEAGVLPTGGHQVF